MRTAGWLLVAALLFVAAIGLAWLGSADPPIDTRNSAFWYRPFSIGVNCTRAPACASEATCA